MKNLTREVIEIEGRKLTVSNRNMFGSKNSQQYLIHENKIYEKVGSQSSGKNLKYCLEKESTQERIWIDAEQISNLLYVEPKGYMKI